MKRALTATVVLAAALLLAGCSTNMGTSEMPAQPMPEPGLVEEGGARDAAEGSTGSTVEDRAVITTGSMSVTVDDPIAAAADAVDLVAAAKGRIDSRSERPATEGQAASATLVLRVPAESFEQLAKDLAALGEVREFTTDASDVTQQKQDLDARINALQASVDRLTTLLANATSTADLIEIENALSQRQAELDSLTTQRDYLDDQIDFSTMTVMFLSPSTAAPGAPTTFWDGLLAGWAGLLAFLAGTLVVVGTVLPWLLLLAVLGAIVLGIVWLAHRGRRTPKTDDAPRA